MDEEKGGLRKSRPNQSRKLDDDTMTTEDIFKLSDKDIFSIAESDHCIFMRAIDSFLYECENEIKKSDYKLHCRFIWDKTNGVCPAFTIRYSLQMDVFSRELCKGWLQYGNQADMSSGRQPTLL